MIFWSTLVFVWFPVFCKLVTCFFDVLHFSYLPTTPLFKKAIFGKCKKCVSKNTNKTAFFEGCIFY